VPSPRENISLISIGYYLFSADFLARNPSLGAPYSRKDSGNKSLQVGMDDDNKRFAVHILCKRRPETRAPSPKMKLKLAKPTEREMRLCLKIVYEEEISGSC